MGQVFLTVFPKNVSIASFANSKNLANLTCTTIFDSCKVSLKKEKVASKETELVAPLAGPRVRAVLLRRRKCWRRTLEVNQDATDVLRDRLELPLASCPKEEVCTALARASLNFPENRSVCEVGRRIAFHVV